MNGTNEEQDLLNAINRYLHISTRGGENRRVRLWSSGGIPLRRRGIENYTNIYGHIRTHNFGKPPLLQNYKQRLTKNQNITRK